MKKDEQYYEVIIQRVSIPQLPFGTGHEGPIFGRRRALWQREWVEEYVKKGDIEYMSDRFVQLLTWLIDEVNDPNGEE